MWVCVQLSKDTDTITMKQSDVHAIEKRYVKNIELIITKTATILLTRKNGAPSSTINKQRRKKSATIAKKKYKPPPCAECWVESCLL